MLPSIWRIGVAQDAAKQTNAITAGSRGLISCCHAFNSVEKILRGITSWRNPNSNKMSPVRGRAEGAEVYRAGRGRAPPSTRRKSYVKRVPNHQPGIPRAIFLSRRGYPSKPAKARHHQLCVKNPEPRKCQEPVEPQSIGRGARSGVAYRGIGQPGQSLLVSLRLARARFGVAFQLNRTLATRWTPPVSPLRLSRMAGFPSSRRVPGRQITAVSVCHNPGNIGNSLPRGSVGHPYLVIHISAPSTVCDMA